MKRAKSTGQEFRGKDFFIKYLSIYENDVFRFIMSLVKDPEDASDVLQRTMGLAWANIDRLRDVDKAKSWLFTIASNVAKKLFSEQQIKNSHQYNGIYADRPDGKGG